MCLGSGIGESMQLEVQGTFIHFKQTAGAATGLRRSHSCPGRLCSVAVSRPGRHRAGSAHQEPLPASSSSCLCFLHLPDDMTRDELAAYIHASGFRLNFAYRPRKKRAPEAFKYAFVNFVSKREAFRAMRFFDGWTPFVGAETLQVNWRTAANDGVPPQSLRDCVSRYHAGCSLWEEQEDQWLPSLYDPESGRRQAWKVVQSCNSALWRFRNRQPTRRRSSAF